MQSKIANYTSVHPEYAKVNYKWEEIIDALMGERHIKMICLTNRKYLPELNSEPTPDANYKRYVGYVQRAVFYNATARTLDGMAGQVFSKPPVADFPQGVSYLQTDPAGTGITLEQQAKSVLRSILSFGRAGLWIDYPTTDGATTVSDLKDGEIRPVIRAYKAPDILNWRTARRNAKTIYTFIMLREKTILSDDGYSALVGYQYRELRLDDNGKYCARVWSVEAGSKQVSPTAWVYPTDFNGDQFTEIPFTFVGIHDNDSDVDEPPLYDLVRLNFAHFRNSADYEDMVHMVGQITPWISGLDQNWYEQVLHKTIFLGSRACIPLPAGGAAGLLQGQQNGLAKEAMDQKEQQMVALGARLVQKAIVVKTATESSNDKVTEVSTLAAAARNTTAAYQTAFAFCSYYSGDKSEIKFELSTDFDMARMSSQEILALVATWQAKGITTGELRENLRRGGYATEPLAQAIANGVAKEPGMQTPNADSVSQQSNLQKPADNRVSAAQ